MCWEWRLGRLLPSACSCVAGESPLHPALLWWLCSERGCWQGWCWVPKVFPQSFRGDRLSKQGARRYMGLLRGGGSSSEWAKGSAELQAECGSGRGRWLALEWLLRLLGEVGDGFVLQSPAEQNPPCVWWHPSSRQGQAPARAEPARCLVPGEGWESSGCQHLVHAGQSRSRQSPVSRCHLWVSRHWWDDQLRQFLLFPSSAAVTAKAGRLFSPGRNKYHCPQSAKASEELEQRQRTCLPYF